MVNKKPSSDDEIANNLKTMLAIHHFLSVIKIRFGTWSCFNRFILIPTIQISHPGYRYYNGFILEIIWGRWGIGLQIYIVQ